jgi:protoporphyrinogen oxidase
MHQVKRISKIFIQNKWINDPVNPFEILLKFFPKRSLSIFFSYLKARLMPVSDQNSFEGLVLNRFGTGLNEFFFKPYSEKLFGIPADKISAEWAKRKIRISGFKDMLKKDTKLYFNYFYYPDRGGYGAISQKLFQCVAENVHLQTKVTAIKQNKGSDSGETQSYTCTFEGSDGKSFTRDFDALVSTLPLNKFSHLLGFNVNLAFRPARLVYLNVNKANLTGMQWFYVADAAYRINRVAEFKNFSADHNAAGNSVICVEITAQEDFSVENVISELERIGVLNAADVIDTKLIEIPCAYPIYDLNYSEQINLALANFKQHPNIHLLGRNARFSHVDVDEIFYAAKQMTTELVASLSTAVP